MISPSPPRNGGWLVCSRPKSDALLRLFCFPYSGAGPSIFYRWPDGLPPWVELCAVQYPGRGSRLSEPPYLGVEPLVQAAATALGPYLDRPFAFFGHSMGALVSFELARYLRQHSGLAPQLLVVSGHSAPQVPDPDPPIHSLPEPQFIQKLRELNGTPDEVLNHAELRQLLVPIIRADFTVCETYVYQPEAPFDFPMAAYGGLADSYVPRTALEAWQEHTSAEFSLRMFPGDHFYLNTQRPLLLRTLARELDAVAQPNHAAH